jgi:glucose-1-phosphate cytidylyltransferase
MKVILFCGRGMRLRGYIDDVPKPMVQIGSQPLLLHLMKYAHFGPITVDGRCSGHW